MTAFDDLTPLLAQQPDTGLGLRQGVIEQWDPTTAENVVTVGGATLANLPILNTNEALQLRPGDVVGVLTSGASWCILGRLTIPGTPEAASALSMVSSGIDAGIILTQESTAATSPTDLATVGPTATVNIGGSGKCLIIISCQIGFSYFNVQEAGGAVVFVGSGANTVPADPSRTINMWTGVGGPPPSLARIDQYSGVFYLDGLAPGTTTFKLQYFAQGNHGLLADFADRIIVAWPL